MFCHTFLERLITKEKYSPSIRILFQLTLDSLHHCAQWVTLGALHEMEFAAVVKSGLDNCELRSSHV